MRSFVWQPNSFQTNKLDLRIINIFCFSKIMQPTNRHFMTTSTLNEKG